MMYQEILKQVQKAGYFDNHDKVLVAVSGGVDSMNLLHFLHSFQTQLKIEIAIAHVNHQQRQASVEEEAYLRNWASENGVPIFVAYFEGHFTEKNARDFRYAFFRKIMKENGYTALVTGHHADDQAETILMRLIRGSRLRHLRGIRAVQSIAEGDIIRPFLHLKKSDLADIFHFVDASNQEKTYFRNRVRHDYLPQLVAENPKFIEQSGQLSQEIATLFEALGQLTRDIDVTDREKFLKQSPAVQYYLLQAYLENFPDLQVSKEQFEQILHLIITKSHYQHSLKSGYQLILSKDEIHISKISPRTDEQVTEKVLEYGSIQNFAGYQFTFPSPCDMENTIFLSGSSPILLRHRRDGDRIELGTFSKKISRLFIDDKLSLEERSQAIIGEQDGHIIFVVTRNKTYLRKSFKNDIIKVGLYIQKETW